MCGFAGFLNFSGLPGTAAERNRSLGEMVGRLAHRGPDDERRHDDGILALGFRRLSIIDVQGGQQPLWNEDRQILAVVNGEIYNHLELRAQLEKSHTFRTRSDSEVVLHLYEDRGVELLGDVNGMYVLAIWDAPNRRLLLARDRLGIKPLYYAIAGETILFGSELKALLAHPDCPREPDRQALRQGPPVHQPVTPSYVNGVHHLPAGQMIVFEPGKPAHPFPYWSINDHFADPRENPRYSPQYYVERYGELFDDSVRRQLMSDVPLGIFLSGGIDSSLVAAAAASGEAGLHCFTIAEETTAMTGDLSQAQRVADDLAFPLHPLKLNNETLLDELGFDLEHLEYMVWCADSPRFVLEWFFKHELHRYAKTRFPNLKVILTGSGADEFAGGYSTSYASPRNHWDAYLRDHVRPLWESFRQREDRLIDRFPPQARLEQSRSARSDYQHMMFMNVSSLQFYNLWFEDRVSASQGIEARVPFLDHRLVELLASVPPAHYPDLYWNKGIVREQIGRLLPAYPIDFPKIPFIYVPGNQSNLKIKSGILKRTFRDFQDKYVTPANSNLPGPQLEELYRTATSHDPMAHRATRKLLHVMQSAVFKRMCGDRNLTPPSISPVSPLTTM